MVIVVAITLAPWLSLRPPAAKMTRRVVVAGGGHSGGGNGWRRRVMAMAAMVCAVAMRARKIIGAAGVAAPLLPVMAPPPRQYQ